MERMVAEENAEYPTFCCDGEGYGAGHDPWCDNAHPAEQERWVRSQHLGYVDMSIFPPIGCDDPRCCGDDDDDDF